MKEILNIGNQLIEILKDLIEQKKHDKKTFFLLYSLIFLLFIAIIAGYFSYNGKNLIIQTDSYETYLKSFIYTVRWYKNLLKNFSFNISTFSMSLGFGSDIITSLHYYSLGDPLNLLGIIFPARKIALAFQFLILLRLYLLGITFSFYLFHKKKYNIYAILSGTLIYIFSMFSIYTSFMMPILMNICIYFPLMMLGIDKIVEDERPFVYIISIFLSIISNVYYFYLYLIGGLFYTLIKIISNYSYKEYMKIIKVIIKLLGSLIIGTMMGAIILIPVSISLINEYQISSEYVSNMLYNIDFYKSFTSDFTVSDSLHEISLGYGLMTLLGIFFLFKNSGHLKYKILFILSLILLVYTNYTQSYYNLCWIWAFNLLVSSIYVIDFDYISHITTKELMISILLISLYCFIYIYVYFLNLEKVGVEAIVLVSLLLLLYLIKNKHLGTMVLLLGIILSLSISNYYLLSMKEYDLVSQAFDKEYMAYYAECNDSDAIDTLVEDDDIVRVGTYNSSDSTVESNTGSLYDLSSTSYQYNLNNGYVNQFLEEMNLITYWNGNYNNLDERSYLNALFNVNYYTVDNTVSNSSKYKPYGYTYLDSTDYEFDQYVNVDIDDEDELEERMDELKEEMGIDEESAKSIYELEDLLLDLIIEDQQLQYDVYSNKYPLPLGYTYSSYIETEDYEEMSSIEKQQALLQGIVVDDIDKDDYKETKVSFNDKEIDYSIESSSLYISMIENSFVVTQENQTITLNFDGLSDSETYVYFEGLSYQAVSTIELYNEDESIDPYDLYTSVMYESLTAYSRNVLVRQYEDFEEEIDQTITLKTYTDNELMTTKTIDIDASQSDYFSEGEDFLVNMCYSTNGRTSIKITFPDIGVYSFDDLKIICQPMSKYKDYVEDLSEDCLEDIEYKNNTITGEISVSKAKILCMSIPYSTGWTCYVDGKEVEILRANTMFMAVELDQGEHEIRLVYKTPGYNMGFLFSMSGLLLFDITCLYYNIKKKKGSIIIEWRK